MKPRGPQTPIYPLEELRYRPLEQIIEACSVSLLAQLLGIKRTMAGDYKQKPWLFTNNPKFSPDVVAVKLHRALEP